jgi:hypothetical protein
MIPEKPLHVSVSCKRAIRILATPGLDICLSGLDRSSLPRRLDQAVRRDRRDKSVNRADPLHLHHPLLPKAKQYVSFSLAIAGRPGLEEHSI